MISNYGYDFNHGIRKIDGMESHFRQEVKRWNLKDQEL